MSLPRRTLQVLALVCTLIIGTASMAVIVSQTTWFKEWLRGFIVRQADDYVNGRLTIGRLDGNLFFGVEMEDVNVTMNGKEVVALKDVGVNYNLMTFLRGHLVLDHVRLNKPTLHLERTATGWNLVELFTVQTPNPNKPKNRPAIEVGAVDVTDGTLYVEDQTAVATSGVQFPRVIEKIDASLAVQSDANELKLVIANLVLRGQHPQIGINALSGTVRQHEDSVTLENISLRTEETSLRVGGSIRSLNSGNPVLNLKASADKFAMREIGQLVPVLRGYDNLQPAFELNVSGPADRMDVQINAREKEVGQFSGNLTINALGPKRRIAGEVQTGHFNVGALVPNSTVKTDVTARGNIDVTFPSTGMPMHGTYTMNASRAVVAGYEARDVVSKGRIEGRVVKVDAASAAAYGGRATASGIARTDLPLTMDLTGRASGIDMRNLPSQLKVPGVPVVASRLNFGYTLAVRGSVLSGDVQLAASTLADATIGEGTIASFRVGDGPPEYSAKGQVTNLDLQKIGQGFTVSWLDTPKFKSRINAPAFDVKGSGGGSNPLTLEGSGTLVDSEIFGATIPHLDFSSSFGGGDAHVVAKGEFTGLDPSVITAENRVAGMVDGSGNVDVTIRGYANGVSADSIDVTGRVDVAHSTIGGLAIDTAVVDGAYTNRTGKLTELTIEGPDLHAKGQGPIELNDTGSTNLMLHLETPALDRLGTIFGYPDYKGAAIVDAKVTGNGKELKAAGMFDGSNVGTGDNSALDLDGTFDVTVPNLAVADATIHAKSNATFVQVAGQQVNEVAADLTYSKSNLDFDATAKQGIRQLSAKGSMLVHADHREIHIASLALQTEKIVWNTDPASHPTIRYGNNRVAVDDIKLVSGDQTIQAQGGIGSPADTLKVQAQNVDVAQLDALALGDQRLSGRLNANATVSGTTAAPRVAGEFTMTQGAFRTFMFSSFGGKVDYEGNGLTLDVRLEQTPASWITAKGFAPITLFRPNPAGVGHEHVDAPAGDAINIDVASSQIDLGLVQGFTSYVTKVTGTLQANFKVTGSGYDPHLDGAIEIKGGALTAPTLGMSYTGLDTRIDLKPDVVTISEFRILDDDKNWLTVGGSLAVHEGQVGAVDVKLQSHNFKVINNRAADLKFDSDVHLTGTVRAPKLEGTIEVEPGSVDVAEVLNVATDSAYSTTAIEIPTRGPIDVTTTAGTDPTTTAAGAAGIPPAAAAKPEPTTPQTLGLFDSLDMRLSLAIPGDLLLKGNNIKPSGAPIDVGSMNAYVGGAVNLVKAPNEKIRIAGEVNTIRGSYTFQGRRFDILRDGRVRFLGTDVIDPLIDLQASRTISGVQTFVHVRGTMLRPELTFTSNPPLEQADILSLIIFNTPVNELGTGQQVSLATRAQELAGGYLTAGLSESIGHALNLDEFEIQASSDSGLGPSITLGQQISKGLFVHLRQGFGAAQATEFILEYQLTQYLRLQGTVSDVSSSIQRNGFTRVERGGLDLIFFFNY